MKKNDLSSQVINTLRFPLTVAVVYIHFNISRKGISVHGINYGIDNPYWYHFVINLISNTLSNIAVPMFFFFSGYLFFLKKEFNKTVYIQKLRSRFKTLFLPFMLWNIIAIVYQAIKLNPLLSPIFPGAYKTTFIISFERLWNTFFCYTLSNGIFVSPTEYTMTEFVNEPYPINVPMWYVRDLIIMVLFSPLIYWFIKKGRLWFICTTGSFWFWGKYIWPEGGYQILLFTAIFFFSWGAYFSIHNIDFVETMKKYKPLPIIYIIIAIFDTATIGTTSFNIGIHNAGILIGIISLIMATAKLLEKGYTFSFPIISSGAFFVYGFHKIIIDDLAKICFSILHLSNNTYTMLCFYIFIPILTIAFCISTYHVLRLLSPKTKMILTGGR